MKDKFLVYLAGPITGTTYEGCTEWREQVKEMVDSDILTLSPMRGKQYLLERTKGGVIADSYSDTIMSCEKGINCRDFNDVQRADALLVNFLGSKKVSIGTVMEIAWARAFNKPVVCIMEEDNIHNHSMLIYACGYITDNLEEGVVLLEALLLPDTKVPHEIQ